MSSAKSTAPSGKNPIIQNQTLCRSACGGRSLHVLALLPHCLARIASTCGSGSRLLRLSAIAAGRNASGTFGIWGSLLAWHAPWWRVLPVCVRMRCRPGVKFIAFVAAVSRRLICASVAVRIGLHRAQVEPHNGTMGWSSNFPSCICSPLVCIVLKHCCKGFADCTFCFVLKVLLWVYRARVCYHRSTSLKRLRVTCCNSCR